MFFGTIIFPVCITGLFVWFLNLELPTQPLMRSLLNFAAVLGTVLWLLHGFGVINDHGAVRFLRASQAERGTRLMIQDVHSSKGAAYARRR